MRYVEAPPGYTNSRDRRFLEVDGKRLEAIREAQGWDWTWQCREVGATSFIPADPELTEFLNLKVRIVDGLVFFACSSCNLACEPCMECMDTHCRYCCPKYRVEVEDRRNPTVFRSSSFKVWPVRRFASMELELTYSRGPHLNDVTSKWDMDVVHDLSIGHGREIRTSPSKGDRLLFQLEDLSRALREDGASADERCGIHVHVDARDLTYKQMATCLLVYQWAEETLFRLVPPSRAKAKWCQPRSSQIEALGLREAIEGPNIGIKHRVALLAQGLSYLHKPSLPAPPARCKGPGCTRVRSAFMSARNEAIRRLDTEDLTGSRFEHEIQEYYDQLGLETDLYDGVYSKIWGRLTTRSDWGTCNCERDWHRYAGQLSDYRERSRTYRQAHRKMSRYGLPGCPTPAARDFKPARKRTVNSNSSAERYYAFNILSWTKHGTVEIRLHQNSVDGQEFIPWVLFWTAFLDEVKSYRPEQVDALVSSSPEPWMRQIVARHHADYGALWGKRLDARR